MARWNNKLHSFTHTRICVCAIINIFFFFFFFFLLNARKMLLHGVVLCVCVVSQWCSYRKEIEGMTEGKKRAGCRQMFETCRHDDGVIVKFHREEILKREEGLKRTIQKKKNNIHGNRSEKVSIVERNREIDMETQNETNRKEQHWQTYAKQMDKKIAKWINIMPISIFIYAHIYSIFALFDHLCGNHSLQSLRPHVVVVAVVVIFFIHISHLCSIDFSSVWLNYFGWHRLSCLSVLAVRSCLMICASLRLYMCVWMFVCFFQCVLNICIQYTHIFCFSSFFFLSFLPPIDWEYTLLFTIQNKKHT